MTKYMLGYRLGVWNAIREEIKEILIEVAKNADYLTYAELTERIGKPIIEPYSQELRDWLGEISRTEDAAGRGMLSAVVVRKSEDKSEMPGEGFFQLAKELGRKIKKGKMDFWREELTKVHKNYAHLQ